VTAAIRRFSYARKAADSYRPDWQPRRLSGVTFLQLQEPLFGIVQIVGTEHLDLTRCMSQAEPLTPCSTQSASKTIATFFDALRLCAHNLVSAQTAPGEYESKSSPRM
jgi:hypothetical protein